LAPRVQHELHAIATEAIHNAVRHAGARTIELAILPERDCWILRVRDDGSGMVPRETGRPGHGISNMRARASSIGAKISWTTPAGGGVAVEARFHPGGRRSLRMMMRARPVRRSGMLSKP
jgi:signal transduction histidine kinase